MTRREWTDLNTQNDLYESIWTEISNKNSKNVICGSIYRHPSYDTSDFLNYLGYVLSKISAENKEVYICGDFNIDLLKLSPKENFQSFYNLLCSHGFLPLIIHPSRIVENQIPSLIDNIFSNNIYDEICSGNIFLTLSEHLSQFASIKRHKLDIKNIKIYQRDYSKFSSPPFRTSHLKVTNCSVLLAILARVGQLCMSIVC